MWVCDLFVDWGIISRGQILTKISFLLTYLHKSTQRKYRNTFSQLVAAWAHSTNLIGSNFRTITRPEEGNCFYSRHQTDCKYFNKQQKILKNTLKFRKSADHVCVFTCTDSLTYMDTKINQERLIGNEWHYLLSVLECSITMIFKEQHATID